MDSVVFTVLLFEFGINLLVGCRFLRAIDLSDRGQRMYLGEGEINLFKTIVEVFDFRCKSVYLEVKCS